MGIPDQFIEHGDTEELYDISGISSEQIKEKIFSILT
jgi:1-deoxy-D-xylulose-5-phosphate synthase